VDRRSWSLLVAVGAIWGASFLLAAIALRDLSPGFMTFLRTGFAALVMLPIALRRGALGGLRRHAGAVVVVAVVQLAGPFLLIAFGQLEVASGLAGVLVGSTPLWTALLARGFDDEERSHGWSLVGVAVGIVGVAVLLGLELRGSTAELLGGAMLLLAGLGYAAGGFVVKRRLGDVQPVGVVTAAMLAGAVLVTPLAVATAPTELPSLGALAAAIALGTLAGGVGWLGYYTLIAGVGPARASITIYVVPAFAVLYGIVLLGEPATPGTFAGLVLIVSGSWLAAGSGPRRHRDGMEAANLR